MPGLLSVFSITVILAKELVAKGPEEGNHEEHKEKLFFSFMLFVFFMVSFFSEPFATSLRVWALTPLMLGYVDYQRKLTGRTVIMIIMLEYHLPAYVKNFILNLRLAEIDFQ